MKNILFILIGAVSMFVILKILSAGKPVVTDSQNSENFKKLLGTPEAQKLISSKEFKATLRTKECKELLRGVADQYIITLTKNLVS